MKSWVVLIVLLASAIALNVAVLGSLNINNIQSNGFTTFRQEICTDISGKITCEKSVFAACNGVHHKIDPTEFEAKSDTYVGAEKPSPSDRIKDTDISIFDDRIEIFSPNLKLRKFIDSNSMDPLIDEGTTTIEIMPSENIIKVGDIISYNLDGYDYALVHRVVEIDTDEEGVFLVTKGDNYWKKDKKIRFSQVEGVVIGILY